MIARSHLQALQALPLLALLFSYAISGCTQESGMGTTTQVSKATAPTPWQGKGRLSRSEPLQAAEAPQPASTEGNGGAPRETPGTFDLEVDAAPDIGRVPLTVHFSAVFDEGSEPFSYQWDFGDGTRGAGNPASHTYAEAGAYEALLTVTDAAGRVARRQVGIQVDSSEDTEAPD